MIPRRVTTIAMATTLAAVDMRSLGLLLSFTGLALLLVGLLIAGGAVGWFGRLPGDIRVGGDHVRVYLPIVSMLLISVLLTVLVSALHRWL
jgi:hypothetical protein